MDNQPRVIPVSTEQRIQAQVNAVAQIQNKPTNGRGRPTVIDESVVVLLVAAFQNGLTVSAACNYARISRDAFYERYKKDQDFADAIEAAKNHLVLKAGNRINQILDNGADRDAGPMARWVYEKLLPEKYGTQVINNDNRTQNNVFLLNNGQISELTKQPDIAESNPTELLENIEAASEVDARTEEASFT